MAENHSTQRDPSRFQLRSYGWRNVDIGTDTAIRILEQTFQSSIAIERIAADLRQRMSDTCEEPEKLNFNEVDGLLAAVEQLSLALTEKTCSYASSIEKKIEAQYGKHGDAK